MAMTEPLISCCEATGRATQAAEAAVTFPTNWKTLDPLVASANRRLEELEATALLPLLLKPIA